MQPAQLFLPLEEIRLSEVPISKNIHKYRYTLLHFRPLQCGYRCSPALCLSWSVSYGEWGKDLSVILTTVTPKGPPHWVWSNSGLHSDSLRMSLPLVCVCVCVCMETAIPFRYITASVVQYQTREGELVRLSSWVLLVLSCQGILRDFNVV